jgi:hypothetical protein
MKTLIKLNGLVCVLLLIQSCSSGVSAKYTEPASVTGSSGISGGREKHQLNQTVVDAYVLGVNGRKINQPEVTLAHPTKLVPGVHFIDVGTTPNVDDVKARFRIRAENGCMYAVRHESRKSMVEGVYDTYFWIENTTRKEPVTDKVAGSLY